MREEIEHYIDRILRAVLDTKIHQDINDELHDHILSLVEEKMQNGMGEKEAITESLLSIGEPKDLGKKFNSVYRMSQIPLFLGCIMNIIFLSLLFYLITPLGSVRKIDYVLIGICIFLNLLFVTYSIKYITILNRAMNEQIYFAQQKSKMNRSYVENLTNKVLMIGLTLVVVFLLIGTILVMIQEGFHESILNSNYTIVTQFMMYSNYLYFHIIYTKYPKLMITERGFYSFSDIPTLIHWKEVDQYKWTKNMCKYRLDLFNDHKYRKIYGQFPTSDRIIIEKILKQQNI